MDVDLSMTSILMGRKQGCSQAMMPILPTTLLLKTRLYRSRKMARGQSKAIHEQERDLGFLNMGGVKPLCRRRAKRKALIQRMRA